LTNRARGISPKAKLPAIRLFDWVAVIFILGDHFRRPILTSKAPNKVLKGGLSPVTEVLNRWIFSKEVLPQGLVDDSRQSGLPERKLFKDGLKV